MREVQGYAEPLTISKTLTFLLKFKQTKEMNFSDFSTLRVANLANLVNLPHLVWNRSNGIEKARRSWTCTVKEFGQIAELGVGPKS